VFGIRDTHHGWTGWVLRLDKPHKGVNYDHININRIYTHKPDPHTKLPPGVIPVFGTLTKVINGVGDILFYVAAAADTYKCVYYISMFIVHFSFSIVLCGFMSVYFDVSMKNLLFLTRLAGVFEKIILHIL
jgi:hypothetical protein